MASADRGAVPTQRLDSGDSTAKANSRGGRGRKRNPKGRMPAGDSTAEIGLGGQSHSTGVEAACSGGAGSGASRGPVGDGPRRGHARDHLPSGRSRGGQNKQQRAAAQPYSEQREAERDYDQAGTSRGRGGGRGRGGSGHRGKRGGGGGGGRGGGHHDRGQYRQRNDQQEDQGALESAADDRVLNADAAVFVPNGKNSSRPSAAAASTQFPTNEQDSREHYTPAGDATPRHSSNGDRHQGRGGYERGSRPRPYRGNDNGSRRGAAPSDIHPRNHQQQHDRPQQQQGGRRRRELSPSSDQSSSYHTSGARDYRGQQESFQEPRANPAAESSSSSSTQQQHAKAKKTAVKVQPTGSARADEIIEELMSDNCECIVCCDAVKRKDRVWSCTQCFCVFHLRCVQRWGRSDAARVEQQQPENDGTSSKSTSGWACPSCRAVHEFIPTNYWCFCGRVDLNEKQRRYTDYSITPHSCGDICGKRRAQEHCTHRCNQLCHPGPCPPCPAMTRLTCGCGRTTQTVRCSQASSAPTCSSVCDRPLACGRHACRLQCHAGPCDECDHQLEQTCFCGRKQRQYACSDAPVSSETTGGGNGSFSCAEPCHKPLACGNHLCELPCHSGPCTLCELSPDIVRTCHCGQKTLAELAGEGVSEARRESCLDSIPTCGQVCNKALVCGPVDEGNPHRCHMQCHDGPCRPCPSRSVRKCRCGKSTQKLPCKEVLAGKEVLCDRMCNAKRSCGRHRCSQRCCTDQNHTCMLPCGKRLQCGQHKCEELCHRGHCDRCWQTIFDELRCHCGAQVLYPPQPCGTRPPYCNRICSRVHACNHEPQHLCHNEDQCPVCPELVTKLCMGGHEERNAVPCHLDDVSCGKHCRRPMACGEHVCDRMCHRGECLASDAVCAQACTQPRPDCGHACANPCHPGTPCPETACYTDVTLRCPCGRRSVQVSCAKATGKSFVLNSLRTSDLARQLTSVQTGGSSSFSSKFEVTCDTICLNELRIRQMAEALQLNTTPAKSALSQFLIDRIKSEPSIVLSIDAQINELVSAVLRMPPDSHKTLTLPIMSNDHRHIAHEIAEMYLCESQSFDSEPKRSVRVTAFSHSYRPSVPLTDLIKHYQAQVKSTAAAAKQPSTQAATASGMTKLTPMRNEKIPDYFSDP
ncbi:transcriptional repressor NF-X1-like [Sycon ciliatum]|uniref:transcriptional repressor NF-X1-like n=1 Tax=Sycon ciliatum TaxID=27933 RepID=UPI0031F671DD